jgi:hypothetical protein
VLSTSAKACEEAYFLISNHLQQHLHLQLNVKKTESGRLSEHEMHYMGWSFKGGYVRIDSTKTEAFKMRINAEIKRLRNRSIRCFIKRINRKIDGFANYYKHGDVGKQFEALDCFIRQAIRTHLQRYYRDNVRGVFSNDKLTELGFHSLSTAYKKIRSKAVITQPRPPRNIDLPAPPNRAADHSHQMLMDIRNLLEVMKSQQAEMMKLQKKELEILKLMIND